MSATGLVSVMRLAQDAGLHELADQWLSVPGDKGAHAGLKVAALSRRGRSTGPIPLMTSPGCATAG